MFVLGGDENRKLQSNPKTLFGFEVNDAVLFHFLRGWGRGRKCIFIMFFLGCQQSEFSSPERTSVGQQGKQPSCTSLGLKCCHASSKETNPRGADQELAACHVKTLVYAHMQHSPSAWSDSSCVTVSTCLSSCERNTGP